MAKSQRKTFRQILQEEGPRIADHLETRARHASKLAKIQPACATTLYSLKCRAVRELFRLPGHAPFIRDAWTTHRGLLLSIKLTQTDSWLHVPLNELTAAAQQFYGPWAAKRAAIKRWQPAGGVHRSAKPWDGTHLSRGGR